MFGSFIANIEHVGNIFLWVIFAVCFIYLIVAAILYKNNKTVWAQLVPYTLGVAAIFILIIVLKAGGFIYDGLTAKDQVAAQEKKTAEAQAETAQLQQDNVRKDAQDTTVKSADTKANGPYTKHVATIATAVDNGDLATENKEALDLTSHFYADPDTTSSPKAKNAKSPIIK